MQSAATLGAVSFLATYGLANWNANQRWHHWADDDGLNAALNYSLYLVPNVAFVKTLRRMVKPSVNGEGLTWNTLFHYFPAERSSYALEMGFMLVNCVLMSIIAQWLDEHWRGEFGARKSVWGNSNSTAANGANAQQAAAAAAGPASARQQARTPLLNAGQSGAVAAQAAPPQLGGLGSPLDSNPEQGPQPALEIIGLKKVFPLEF